MAKKKHTTDAEHAGHEPATADTDPAPDAPVAADAQPPPREATAADAQPPPREATAEEAAEFDAVHGAPSDALPEPDTDESRREFIERTIGEVLAKAEKVEPGAPTVAGTLPSGDPDMLPPVEVRSAMRPPALQVTVPEQGFEVRERPDAPNYYRVMAARNLMVDGLMAKFSDGQVIDDRNYDLDWLRRNGVELVPCEAPEPYSSNF
jgi:hypothetical protein